ncbi:uncharacterized mitochondrial protein AtMg00810-like [Arachis stenosperma]|uniref:uncharacterized mitochondrial protein AtMg00810-like n=1 Tax=Arachis stenosperma TaxID=217475 RepID=UPI0025AD9BDD|nr:uncharacterized mitochondrial protein AtMg00810-like [Arachis stenosperma]
MGLMSYFLGIEVVQRDDGIFISQKKYANDILKKFQMEYSNPILTPVEEKFKLLREDKGRTVNSIYYKSLIGSLRYLTATRPDIVFGVGLLSRFMEEPCTNHLQVAKRILRYIKCTLNDGIYYENTTEMNLGGYTDSDWAGDIETRKSTSGFVFHLGSVHVIVHKDVKSNNILLDHEFKPHVTDFGFVKTLQHEAGKGGASAGTSVMSRGYRHCAKDRRGGGRCSTNAGLGHASREDVTGEQRGCK